MPVETRLMRKKRLREGATLLQMDCNWENISSNYVEERTIRKRRRMGDEANTEIHFHQIDTFRNRSQKRHIVFHEVLVNNIVLRKKVVAYYDIEESESSKTSYVFIKEFKEIVNCSCETPCNVIGTYETHTIVENGLVKDSRIRTELSSDEVLYLFKMFHYLWPGNQQRDLFVIQQGSHLSQFPPTQSSEFFLEKLTEDRAKIRNDILIDTFHEVHVHEEEIIKRNNLVLKESSDVSHISNLSETIPQIHVRNSRTMITDKEEKNFQSKAKMKDDGELEMFPTQYNGFSEDQLEGFLDEWGRLWKSRSFKRERRALQGLSRRDFELREFQELSNRLMTRTFGTQTGIDERITEDLLPQRRMRRNSI